MSDILGSKQYSVSKKLKRYCIDQVKKNYHRNEIDPLVLSASMKQAL